MGTKKRKNKIATKRIKSQINLVRLDGSIIGI